MGSYGAWRAMQCDQLEASVRALEADNAAMRARIALLERVREAAGNYRDMVHAPHDVDGVAGCECIDAGKELDAALYAAKEGP